MVTTAYCRKAAIELGLHKYRGTPCSVCAGVERYISNQFCVACQKRKSEASRLANPKRTAAVKKLWRQAHPTPYLGTRKFWCDANRDKTRASVAAWEAKHPGRVHRKKANPDLCSNNEITD